MKLKKWNPCFFVLLLLFGATIFSGCEKTYQQQSDSDIVGGSPSVDATEDEEIPYAEGNVILGTLRQNPYVVTNMTSSAARLTQRGITSNLTVNIRTTHYYVKFKPQNLAQYEVLSRDTTMALSDYPIEAQILQNGNRYHDPSLPDSVPTYQYTAVPSDYEFIDSIPYNIIANLYLPELDKTLSGLSDENWAYVEKLLDQAYIQTDNFTDTVKFNPQNPEARYTPGGRIQVFDTRLGALIGMEGVRVEARRWFIVYSATTNAVGNYRMGSRYSRPCNYSLWFATTRFAVREHLFGLTSWINGPKQTNDWNHTINDGYDRFVGHVFRGAFRYHFKHIGGLQRPSLFPNRQVYIAVNRSGNDLGINWMALPIIKVWRFPAGGGNEWDSDEVFSTTCHETAHTSHVLRMNAGLIQYIQVPRILQESWAIAIEWFITNIEYSERGIANYGDNNYAVPVLFPNQFAYQYWNVDFSPDNTCLYIDVLDNVNQFNQFYFNRGFGTVNDPVQGYTLPFIEANLLKHIYGFGSLSHYLKLNKPTGVTDAQIDILIDNFN